MDNTILPGTGETYASEERTEDGVGVNYQKVLFETMFGPSMDAFGRLRVSSPVNLWTSEFQYNKHPLYFDEVTATGGTATHLPNESAVSLAVTASDGSSSLLQTFEFFRYQPGKSHVCAMTFVADALVSGTVKLVHRTKTSGTVVNNKVQQGAGDAGADTTGVGWNIDQLDGLGPSGITLDITKGKLLWLDLSWLSIGLARMGFLINGRIVYVHHFHADDLITPLTTTANLPVRWKASTDASNTTFEIGYGDDDNGFFLEIEGTAAAKTLTAICSTVFSEGGVDKELGHTFSGGNRATYRTGIGTTAVPICSIRPATTLNSITNRVKFILEGIEINADDAMYWEIIYKPTSITNASFSSPVTHSGVEVDIAGTAISGGIVIHAGYVSQNKKGEAVAVDLKTKFPFALDAAGADQSRSLSLVVTTLGGTTKNAAGTFNWVEIR